MEDSKIDSGKEKLSATIPYYLKKRMDKDWRMKKNKKEKVKVKL